MRPVDYFDFTSPNEARVVRCGFALHVYRVYVSSITQRWSGIGVLQCSPPLKFASSIVNDIPN